jgi:phage/plasmid-associated DNA primase
MRSGRSLQKGETYIDGNLIKGIASGGDELEVHGQRENPFSVRHEFTMFLNCNDFPPARPAIGNSFLRVKFPSRYNDEPKLQNEKKSDPDWKDLLQLPAFADGMPWFILEEYMGYL